jgi:hypothetical protein
MQPSYKPAILLQSSYTDASLATVTFIGFNGFIIYADVKGKSVVVLSCVQFKR